MLEFTYQGRSKAGKPVTGKVKATSADVAAGHLLTQGITPIHIEETKFDFNLKSLLNMQIGGGKIKIEELLMFSRQMLALTKAGFPLDNAMSRLAETTKNPILEKALLGVVEGLTSGQMLSVTMANYPKVFNPLMTNIIHIGENSGRLDEAFAQIIKYLELEESTIKRIKSTVRYPMFVSGAIFVAMMIINVMVIPTFAKMFESFNAELPIVTKILIASSDFMIDNSIYLIISAISFIWGLRYYLRTPQGKMLWHKYQLQIPLIGKILLRIYLTRFSNCFSMVIKSGVPLSEGITMVAQAMGNVFFRDRILLMNSALARGEPLSRAAQSCQLFSPLVLQMLTVGEETGTVDKALEDISDFYEREVDYDLKTLNDAMEPILLAAIGVMVLILALGVFLPMWDMAKIAKSG